MPLEVLCMLLKAGKYCSPIEIILEQLNLPLVGQIIATWVEVVNVHAGISDVI